MERRFHSYLYHRGECVKCGKREGCLLIAMRSPYRKKYHLCYDCLIDHLENVDVVTEALNETARVAMCLTKGQETIDANKLSEILPYQAERLFGLARDMKIEIPKGIKVKFRGPDGRYKSFSQIDTASEKEVSGLAEEDRCSGDGASGDGGVRSQNTAAGKEEK